MTLCVKFVLTHGYCYLHFVIFKRRAQNSKKAAHNKVIYMPFLARKLVEVNILLGGNYGVVIRDLCVIDDVFQRKRLCSKAL